MHLFVCGYPSDVGGANTELWHTVKLWRRFGAEVTLIPTWKADPGWRRRLDAAGCRTCESSPDDLQNVPGLGGGVVVSMCNTRFLAAAKRFRELRCKIVWLGCMNWLFAAERLHYRRHGVFDRHVFQSRYQHEQLRPQLAKWAERVRELGPSGGGTRGDRAARPAAAVGRSEHLTRHIQKDVLSEERPATKPQAVFSKWQTAHPSNPQSLIPSLWMSV